MERYLFAKAGRDDRADQTTRAIDRQRGMDECFGYPA